MAETTKLSVEKRWKSCAAAIRRNQRTRGSMRNLKNLRRKSGA